MYVFAMPSLGADMTTGMVVAWHVAPGDVVKHGDIVATIETDKGSIDVECWADGTVARLLAPLKQKLPVGAPLALLAQGGESVEEVARADVPAARPAPTPADATPSAPVASSVAPAAPVAAPVAAPAAPPPERGRVRASPAARRRAEALAIPLEDVAREHPDAPVSLADVERFAAARGSAAVGAQPPPAEGGAAALRRAIAAAMARSKREIPHYYLGTEIVVERAAQWLDRRNAAAPVAQRVLFIALALRAVALALRDVPSLNGTYVGDAFRPGPGVHLGIAVALRDGGVVAPALHDADRGTLDELMARLADLLARARSGQLRGAEMTDATITVTSLGELGADTVYGVINPPQVALVGLGRVVTRACVVDGAVVPARVLHATLSADHRVTDGMRGARFLAALDRLLQHPEELA